MTDTDCKTCYHSVDRAGIYFCTNPDCQFLDQVVVSERANCVYCPYHEEMKQGELL